MKKLDNYLMILATIFWSGAFIAGKYCISEFPVFSLTFFRFFFASIVMFFIMKKMEPNHKVNKQEWKYFLILGIIGMIGYHVLFFECLKYTTATNSSLIGATNPLITTIFSAIFLKEVIKPKNIISICISFLGVILIISNGKISTFFNMNFNIGDLLMLVAVICWAIYSVISKNALKISSPIKVINYSFLVCWVLLIPFVIYEKPWIYLSNVTINGWFSVIYMAVFASVGGYLIQQISIKKIGPSKTALYINLVPVFSMILAFLILGETIHPIKIVAAMFIICGVFFNSYSKENMHKNSEEDAVINK